MSQSLNITLLENQANAIGTEAIVGAIVAWLLIWLKTSL